MMLCCGKSKEPFECNIELLDGTHIIYSKAQDIKRTTKCQILIDTVCLRLKLIEKEYFGLCYYDKHMLKHWLDPNKSFAEDITFTKAFDNLPCILYFGVRFYAADPCALKEEITRYQFFLQLKKDILDGKLTCSQKRAAEVSALALQSEIGDYHPSEHKRGYVSEFRFLPNQTEKFEIEVARLHATYKGLVPASAEMQLLKKCRQFDLYGIELHSVRGETGTPYELGISPRGIEKFKNKQRVTVFYWPRIESVNYKDNHLKIEVMSKQERTTIHTFILSSPTLCQYVLKSIADHHVFYRLPQNMSTSTWSRKHRYSGRPETETFQSEVEREEPEVERGSSKRFPPRSRCTDDKENNDAAVEVERSDAGTNWPDVLLGKKGGMFSNTESSPSKAVNYMTPKNERRERNRQLQSLSDTENRHRRHRSRGRSSGDESDSPSKRRIRARARQRSNIASDGSEVSHHARRRRRKYHTDTEMTRGLPGATEERRNNNVNSRRTKRMSKEDLSARQQLFQHIQKDFVDISDKSPEELHDIPYTEIKTEGNPHHVKSRHHNRRHHSSSKRASGVSANSYTRALEDGMVPPLPVTTGAASHERHRNHGSRYGSPGQDWDTRTATSIDRNFSPEARTKHKSKHRKSGNPVDPDIALPMYSQI